MSGKLYVKGFMFDNSAQTKFVMWKKKSSSLLLGITVPLGSYTILLTFTDVFGLFGGICVCISFHGKRICSEKNLNIIIYSKNGNYQMNKWQNTRKYLCYLTKMRMEFYPFRN